MSKTRTKSSAKQRIVETAERLFYAEGVRAVGVDRIIAEAEVAKMTLYNHFASKDDLVLAVLEYREQQFEEYLQTGIERAMKKGVNRLEAFFATLKRWFQSAGFRGCSFMNASIELADATHPASMFAARHKRVFHKQLSDMVEESCGSKAATMAPAIALLVEGAIISAVMSGKPDAADVARDAAMALIVKSKSRSK